MEALVHPECTEVEAEHIYLMINKERQLSRAVRAEWFFNHLGSTVKVRRGEDVDNDEVYGGDEEVEVVSILPRDPPQNWNLETSSLFPCKVSSTTRVTFLSRCYCLVFCLDLSPSVAVVDIQNGELMINQVMRTLKHCLESLCKPFYIPGSKIVFQPQLYVSVIAHVPFCTLHPHQVLLQGWHLTTNSLDDFLVSINNQLLEIEDSLADALRTMHGKLSRPKFGGSIDSNSDDQRVVPLPTPHTDFVTLLRFGILSLQLLPDNSGMGIVLVSDSVIAAPDMSTLDSVLTHLRSSTISFSFLQLGSPYHPHCCLGFIPYPDVLEFLAAATSGAYFSKMPETDNGLSSMAMNAVHEAFFAWRFQWGKREEVGNLSPVLTGPADSWHTKNHYFYSNKPQPLLRKNHLDSNIHTSLSSVLSCRFQEGYWLKEVLVKENHLQVVLVLPWKHNVIIEYNIKALWPSNPLNYSCHYEVFIEGTYDFLLDYAYHGKKNHCSMKRSIVIKNMWSLLHEITQTDQLLVRLHSLSSNTAYYCIPESIKSGIPLFNISANCNSIHLYSSDVAHPQFQAFWKPICMLDINVWQKWMHVHRFGLILEFDRPLPKYLHLPTPSGRYHIIQCRQAVAAVHNLLTEWCSFVLVENHFYVKLSYSDLDKPPKSFYVIRVTSKPPSMVIHLAFLSGTSNYERNQCSNQLREKMLTLSIPQRPVIKDSMARKGLVSSLVDRDDTDAKASLKRGSSQITCCVLLRKPLDKIICCYDRLPTDYFDPLATRSYPLNGIKNAPVPSLPKSASNLTSILHQYLKHDRWIWAVQSGTSCPVSLHAVDRILSTLTKRRLREGFNIAHSNSGMLNLVLELDMKGHNSPNSQKNSRNATSDDVENICSCVVQYVLFPPHSTTTSIRESVSEDETGNEMEVPEADGELQLVTECWIEPQTGIVTNSPSERKHFEGREYKQLSNMFYAEDLECVATMVTFEHLSLLCQNPDAAPPVPHSSVPSTSESSIRCVPFTFDLMRLIPKCQQTEMLFSTFIQDLSFTMTMATIDESGDNSNADVDAPNQLLMDLLFENLARFNDKEIFISQVDNFNFLHQIQTRTRDLKNHPFPFWRSERSASPNKGGTETTSQHQPSPFPRWKCFIKGISLTHILLTFIPASFQDLKILACGENGQHLCDGRTVHYYQDNNDESTSVMQGPNDYSVDTESRKLNKSNSSDTVTKVNVTAEDVSGTLNRTAIYGSIILPIYIYDCPLAGIINHLIYPEETRQFKDIFLDQTFKPKMELGEDTVTLRSDTQSSEGSKHTSPEPHSEDSNESPDKLQLKQHSNDVEMIFSKCFVVGVFRSLHLNYKVHVYDVQSAVDGVCEESLLEVDISNYIQTVCGHVREFKISTALECMHYNNLVACQNHLNCNMPKLEQDSSEDISIENSRPFLPADKLTLTISDETENCDISQPLHTQIKNKFTSIVRKSFIPVPSNPDFFFYCPPNFQKTAFGSKSEIVDVSDSNDDSAASEDDRGTRTFKSETVEFRSEHGSVSVLSKKARTEEFLTEHDAAVPGFEGSQASMMSNVDSNSMCSILNDVCDPHEDGEDNIPPLFIHLTCTVRIRNNMGNCSVRCIPTCLYEILTCLENPVSEVDLSDLHLTLDITCLTLSPHMDSLLSGKSQHLRTTSFCSVSPLPTDTTQMSDKAISIRSSSEDIFPSDTHGDQLSHLPDFQHQAVTKAVEELKWMIRDEIASAMLDFFPLTEAMLDMVASHVQSSPGRPGCVVEEVPLLFVFGPDQSLDKFIKEFKNMSLTGFHLAQSGEYYYLIINRRGSYDISQCSGALTGKFFSLSTNIMDDGPSPLDFESPCAPLCVTSDDGGKRLRKEYRQDRHSSRRSKLGDVGKQDSIRGDDSDTEDQRPRSKSDVSGYRQHLLRMSKKMEPLDDQAPSIDCSVFRKGEVSPLAIRFDTVQDSSLTDAQEYEERRKLEEGQDLLKEIRILEDAQVQPQEMTVVDLQKPYSLDTDCLTLQQSNSTSCGNIPGFNSDVSSIIESGQCSITEDGYDGDSSDVDNESDWWREAGIQLPRLPKFWLILKICHDRVNVYFHTRDTEETNIQLQHGKDVYRQVIKNIRNICKVVNQTLLLQDLHDTRTCNQLLEPEANEDIWKYDDDSKILRSHSLHARPPRRDRDLDRTTDESGDYLKANMDFMPGAFACKVVWQTHFVLHPRLKTGPGRTGMSRGIQALRTVLNPFSVNNRENMFVYVEKSGAVFYLRLNESQFAAHGSHSHGLDSTPVSRSSSVVALPQMKKANDEEELPEPRPRVNSLSEREPQLPDTASVASRMSGGRQKMEDSIQLLIHGISEAGPDIKEELVQVLQNRLDEAVLDVISITLSRNPMCKLTLEDVQFIQKTNEHPKTVIQFTIPAHALQYLLALSSYLRQNLLQFLHTPKFIDNKAESHFQDYNPNGGETRLMKEGDVFLYNRPQGSGNKGIALIAFSLVDGQGNPVEHVSCTRPSPIAYKDNLTELDFETLTSTSLYVPDAGKRPGPFALIQLRIWERGKVELDLLTEKLKHAVRYALWDIVMEYRLLTAPLTEAPSFEETTVCTEPLTPVKLKLPTQDTVKDRGASPLSLFMQPVTNSSVPTTPQPSPFVMVPYNSEPEVPVAMDADLLHQQEKYEIGEKGTLHPVYSCLMKDWSEFGIALKVPTMSANHLSVTSQYVMEQVLREFRTIVANLVPDTTLKTFCKTLVDDQESYVPHNTAQRERRIDDQSQEENNAASRPLPGNRHSYMIVGRDIKQWRTSVSCLEDTTDATTHHSYRYCQRFSPVTALSEKPDGTNFWSPGTSNATPTVTSSGPTSVGSCSSLLFSDTINIFIPRQRLLLVMVTDLKLSIYTYNWAADHNASLMNLTCRLVHWHNARSCLLSSLTLQKMGLFNNQPFGRRPSQIRPSLDKRIPSINPFLNSIYEIDLLKLTSPPSRDVMRKSSTSQSAFTFSEVWFESKPPRPIHKTPYNSIRDPVLKAGRQMQDSRIVDRREMQKKLSSLIQCSGAPGNVSLTEDSLTVLKQFSRIEHYCLTPLLFMPQWRWQVAASRDHTIQGSDSELSSSPNRSSHSSGSSIKGIDSRGRRQSINLPIMQAGQNSPKATVTHHRTLSEETWHVHLSSNYIQEFVQYLQNLGFVPLQTRSTADKAAAVGLADDGDDLKSHLRSAMPLISRTASAKKNNTNCYVQKCYLGSLILLELSLVEPYFCVRMYGIEGGRLQSPFKGSVRRYNSQTILTFADECDKLKVLIHLHSFTYDYHLRSIHSYISGRQLIFKQGYHLTSFLDDFVKYYQKSPNFSWNLIYQGILRVEDATTSPTALYNHLLTHDKSYGMQVLRMVPVLPDDREVDNEYVLVQLRTQKVSYQDSNEIRRTDDFDIDLLISHDTSAYPWGTENCLVLKYYIILTSRRELYPRLAMEKKLGKFRTVATATPISSRKVSLVSMERPDSDKLVTPGSSRKVSLSSSESDLPNPDRDSTSQSDHLDSFKEDIPVIESSSLPNACTPIICIEEERSDSMSAKSDTESTFSVHQMSGTFTSRSHLGIRQEAVNYLGYFSTTEELMNQIMVEQAHVAKSHIEKILETATVRCRRDSLWKNLLVGVRDSDDSRKRRDDHKESQNTGLTFKEFTDLLTLVTVSPLNEIDSQLAPFLNMHTSWHQSLVKVLISKYGNTNRYFVDGATQYVVVLNPNYWDTFMMLAIQPTSCKASLAAVFREPAPTLEHTPQRPNFHAHATKCLIEDFVNTCCFHLWSCIL